MNKSIPLYYYQYDYNEETKKFNNPKSVPYNGTFFIDNPISLLINLNRGLDNPYDEEKLINDYKKIYQKNKVKANEEYCKNHSLIKEFIYAGRDYLLSQEDTGQDINRDNDYYERYCRKLGLERPPFRDYCDCSYGFNRTEGIKTNFYLFHMQKRRLFIIGSSCIKKFNIYPKCKLCEDSITINTALTHNHYCKVCKDRFCFICRREITEPPVKNKYCNECYMIGCYKFNPPHNPTILDIFKVLTRDVFKDLKGVSPAVKTFINRIDKFA
jgi:hypothetical protein